MKQYILAIDQGTTSSRAIVFDEQCKMYRARLQTYAQSRRLYREDAAGERVYLDEKATQDARASVEKQVKEYCGA